MNFKLFEELYSQALEYDDLDMYVAERVWQDWMDSVGDPGKTLNEVYFLAHAEIKEIRERLGFSRIQFSRNFCIPNRTVENWEYGNNRCPDYVKTFLSYAAFNYE